MKEKKEFYSVPELAGLMHMSRVGVFKKVQKGEIKAKKIGKSYAIPASEADQFITHEEPARYGEISILKSDNGKAAVEVIMRKDAIWLNLNQIAELFGRDKSVIARHIDNIYEEGELDRGATVANFATVQKGSLKYEESQEEHYNVDVVISVGYRVKSRAGLQFRAWSLDIVKEYLFRGYSINEKSLKAGHAWLNRLKKDISAI